MPIRGIVGICTAFALLCAPAAAATTRFASPTGAGPSGAGGCLQANPCAIEPAIEDAAVVDGDEVVLFPGPYNVAAATLTVSDAITIRPRDAGTRPVISGTDDTVLSLNDDATVRDVAIQNTTATGNGAALTAFAANPLVERVVVESTITAGTTGQSACILFDGTLRDSVCRMIESSTSNFGVALGTTIATPTGTFTPRFVNVTAVGSGSITNLIARSASPNINIAVTAQNVIAPAVIADANNQAGSSASVTLANSNFQSSTPLNGGTATAPNTGTNQNAAPLFVNAANGDFRQAVGSPTINAGATDAFLGTQDLDFEARSQGANPDIGADEFNIPATPTITDTDPDSPADDNTPEVKGTAPAGSTVRIFSTSDCSGTPLATGTAAQFTSPGLTITVADNSTTTMRATASDALSHASACSAPFPYVESTPPPPPLGDTKAPETTIGAKPKATVKTRKRTAPYSIAFSADEAATFRCSLDGAAPAPCNSPSTGKAGKGPHTFTVVAVDAAGNQDSSPAAASWKVKRKRKH